VNDSARTRSPTEGLPLNFASLEEQQRPSQIQEWKQMTGMVLVLAVAAVLQGEAGGIGPSGMEAVADTMLARRQSPQYGGTWEEVLEAYYATDEPGADAIAIAYAAVMYPWTPQKYVYAYSDEDRRTRHWRVGDKTIDSPSGRLHLSEEWPGES